MLEPAFEYYRVVLQKQALKEQMMWKWKIAQINAQVQKLATQKSMTTVEPNLSQNSIETCFMAFWIHYCNMWYGSSEASFRRPLKVENEKFDLFKWIQRRPETISTDGWAWCKTTNRQKYSEFGTLQNFSKIPGVQTKRFQEQKFWGLHMGKCTFWSKFPEIQVQMKYANVYIIEGLRCKIGALQKGNFQTCTESKWK